MIFSARFSFLLLLTLAMLASACKGTKEGDSRKKLSATAALDATVKNNVAPNTVQITGRCDATMGPRSIGFSYKIHVLRDSLIWIKVTKFGFEGARALIRKDSVFVINRLERTFTAADYSLVKKYTGLEGDFEMVQNILLGNFKSIPAQQTLKVKDKRATPYVYRGTEGNYTFDYEISGPPYKMAGMEAWETGKETYMQLRYTGFEELPQKQHVANEGFLKVAFPDTASLQFKHTKIDPTETTLSVPFSVPKNYKRD